MLERFHAEELRADALSGPREPAPGLGRSAGSLDRLLALFEAGWRRTGFGASDDELQYRDRAVAALARYHERHAALGVAGPCGSSAASPSRSARTSCAAASIASTSCPTAATS